jgi:SAM-dependent methyltransferase
MDASAQKKIEQRFDRESSAWRDLYRRSGRNPFAYNDKLYRRRYVLELLGTGAGRVLDLGCGAGEYFADLKRAGFSAVGVDFSAKMAALAAAADGGSARVARAEAGRLPFRTHSFAALIAVGLIEYLPGDDGVLREIRRTLAPGGRAVVTLRNRRCLERRWWDGLVRRGWMRRPATSFFREHDLEEFRQQAARLGFGGFAVRYCHFYPLPWPLSKFLAPLNNLLAHLWERLFARGPFSRLGSTIVCSFQAPESVP